MAYPLEKWVWTEADFDSMGWHDAKLYALAFFQDTFELALDIDYIFEWVQPEPPAPNYTFWVSPCTLVFENVTDLEVDIAPYDDLTIDGLTRGDETFIPRNAAAIGGRVERHWTIDCHGAITMRSIGFKQYVRRVPRHLAGQSMSLNDRGGISFVRAAESKE
jgi:hypothetical protein